MKRSTEIADYLRLEGYEARRSGGGIMDDLHLYKIGDEAPSVVVPFEDWVAKTHELKGNMGAWVKSLIK